AMKRSGWFFLAAALAAGTLPATAADFPAGPEIYAPRPAIVIFRWTGFYLGVNVGGGFGPENETSAPILNASSAFSGNQAGVLVPAGTSRIEPGPANIDVSGWLAGGQIGLNYQWENFVVGSEAQANWANLKGSSSCSSTAVSALGGV